MINKLSTPVIPLSKMERHRIKSLDFARGFTVLIMPAIHVVMLYSNSSVQHSALGIILAFIAEGPGAQLFMMVMGVSFVFSLRVNAKYVFKRAIFLLIAAYLLNFLKFIVPLSFGWLPGNLLSELQLSDNRSAAIFFILLGDILHFASFAYVIIYLVSRLKYYQLWSTLLAVAIMFLSPFAWDLETTNNFLNYFLQLSGGHPPNVFFPLFPWLVYPLIGLTLGYYLKKEDASIVIYKAGLFGFIILIISLLLPATETTTAWLSFYRTKAPDTIFHLGIVLCWLTIFHWLSKKINSNYIFNLLTFCSRHITLIYIIQWVTICWCLPFTGYLCLDTLNTFYWMIGITTFTLLLTFLIIKFNAQPKSI